MTFFVNGAAVTAVLDPTSPRSYKSSSTAFTGDTFITGPDFQGHFTTTKIILHSSSSLSPDILLGRDWTSHVCNSSGGNVAGSSALPPLSFDLAGPNLQLTNVQIASVSPFTNVQTSSQTSSLIQSHTQLQTQIAFSHFSPHDLLLSKTRQNILTSSYQFLVDVCRAHGIEPAADAAESRSRLLSHLLNGLCCETGAQSCSIIARSYSSSRALGDDLLDSVFQHQDDTTNLTAAKLITLASAIREQSAAGTVLQRRTHALSLLRKFRNRPTVEARRISATFGADFEELSRPELRSLCKSHGISFHSSDRLEDLRNLVSEHLTSGKCMQSVTLDAGGITNSANARCALAVQAFLAQGELPVRPDFLGLYNLLTGSSSASKNTIKRLLTRLNQPYEPGDSVRQLRKNLMQFASKAIKGKAAALGRRDDKLKRLEDEVSRKESWPRLIGEEAKSALIQKFQNLTSNDALASLCCASCAAVYPAKQVKRVKIANIKLNLFERPDLYDAADIAEEDRWLDPEVEAPPFPFVDGILKHCLLDAKGLCYQNDEVTGLLLCRECRTSVGKGDVPPLSLANRLYFGPVPEELTDLTVVEESMIARCRAKSYIIQLRDYETGWASQRGVKGHIIVYPQDPQAIADTLPPSVEDITAPLCVIFVGPKKPTKEWIREHAKPWTVRGDKVRRALQWLKSHNKHYKDIIINEGVLNYLESNPVLPVHLEHVPSNGESDSRVSGYDTQFGTSPATPSSSVADDIALQSVVVANVEGSAKLTELRSAAMKHMLKKGTGYIQVSRGQKPVNGIRNPDILPLVYPKLFPYGIGGTEDCARSNTDLSLEKQLKHLFNLRDARFRSHYSFLFTAFSMIQRKKLAIQTKLKCQRDTFESVAQSFASTDAESIHLVSERVAKGDFKSASNEKEREVLRLMRHVKAVTSHVPGTASARAVMRREVKALIADQGLPHFYLTINPADIYNPIVRLLAGDDIDVDEIVPADYDWKRQTGLVATDPTAAARFFNVYMKAFIKGLLGFDKAKRTAEDGVLGRVKAYYGCVEAQGRGTLHCHMLVWVEGGINVDEIKQKIVGEKDLDFKRRLIDFLDDTISNYIPEDPDPCGESYDPVSIRGPTNDSSQGIEKDRHLLALRCQLHSHSATCYKYDPDHCRFDLDASNFCANTTYDEESGELCLRCLDGLVNNFNWTILQAIRCNMDLKFVASGPSTKAVLHYITDYISKSQLKSHVAYAALELAAKKLEKYDPKEDEITHRAKRLLYRCAYSMLSHQELSAQQVMSYVMGFEDHFKSHEFSNLYLSAFNSIVCRVYPPNEQGNVSENDDAGGRDLDTEEDNTDDRGDEVTIQSDPFGNIEASSPVTDDYIWRGNGLDSVCLYDFVSRVEKVNITADDRLHRKSKGRQTDPPAFKTSRDVADDEASECEESDAESCIDDEDEDWIDEEMAALLWDSHHCRNPLLMNDKRIRPRVEFKEGHRQHRTHRMRIRSRRFRVVPVLVGERVPRRQKGQESERYCRLMLLLFKPWRTPLCLKNEHQTWKEAFDDFTATCDRRLWKIMDNLQALHECQDARDDHFKDRTAARKRTRNFKKVTTDQEGQEVGDNVEAELPDEQEMLEHLRTVENMVSNKRAELASHVISSLFQAEKCGFLRVPPDSTTPNEPSSCEVRLSNSKQIDIEKVWQQSYEQRKTEQRKRRVDFSCAPEEDSAMVVDGETGVSFVDALRDQAELAGNTQIVSDGTLSDVSMVASEDVAARWSLNSEQLLAFNLVTAAAETRDGGQLRMILSGAGGTGKSRVINALTDYFSAREESRRFRLASFTGVAAHNIHGMTIHSALSLGLLKKKGNKSRTHADLIRSWAGVDFLFIDEYSMIGCKLLHDMSEALSIAKECDLPFGGINIIFAGDFAQLPPIAQGKLYTPVAGSIGRSNGKSHKRSDGEINLLGKMLWLSLNKVVMLTEVMRQKSENPDDVRFIELLGRLREGRCNQSDYELLKSRQATNVNVDWDSDEWKHTPVLVTENATKDHINAKAAEAFARRTGQTLHWYHALDRRGKQAVESPELQDHLTSLSSSQTSQRLGALPLVIGMPVMLCSNYDVENGIVNGCVGILKKIRYWEDGSGNRYATSVVIESQTVRGPPLPHLQPGQFVAMADKQTMSFTNTKEKTTLTLTRTQLPIMPAFSITAHKSQGLTLPTAMIDLAHCRGTESPYVMVSRVKSLAGLLILGPFDIKIICKRQSEDLRREFSRQTALSWVTKAVYAPSSEARLQAVQLLEEHDLTHLLTNVSLDSPNWQDTDVKAEQQRWKEVHSQLEEPTGGTNKKRMLRETSSHEIRPRKRLCRPPRSQPHV